MMGSALFQTLFGFGRIFLVLFTLWFFCSYFSTAHDGVVPIEIVRQWQAANPFANMVSERILIVFASFLNGPALRYALAPLAAILSVLFAGAYYVKDIYALPTFRSAFRYVFASMFGLGYPLLTIDGGRMNLKPGERNLIEQIGGPGAVLVEPGSAAIFRQLRGQSQTVVGSTYVLAPFETVANTIDLDEHQGDKNNISAMTRDGIQVTIVDVHFRYRIRHRTDARGRPVPSTPEEPYPFAPNALANSINNLSVQDDGLDKWTVAVERALTGAITDFIAANNIDFLTAPCVEGNEPRLAMRNELFMPFIQNSLERLGAELVWADIGHMEINLDTVDEQRISVWAAPWMGESSITKAYGEALRQAYRELGRAQAQAEIIMGITAALESTNLSNDTPDNLRKILMARTAQVLDSISSRNNGDLRGW